ncbi:RND family efflux transporter, MFP subunit [Desulfosporosinus orientis DSM 765]|uniref:RND family efflux transporter, MFP subunit n=1 Tax=Desulfosporosinus orientis (strain ATCC 19365 / DSM 765 / NCIMB 8382 / VKM B-1628 / Singapore I) TaxID=768706 RepID=G7WFF4_DESOD|nr:efflux RND transporter periplasmic adaptor subunit [Desulfosporosinus orientis]AET68397.1 RND family efflux transporter, MFP subunit [Desulfosporosinus orientis DSM 765]
MSKKRVVLGLIIVIIFIGGVAFFHEFGSLSINAAKDKGSAAAVTSNKVAVKVITPKEAAQSDGSYYKATIEADQEGIVSSKNSGKVISVLFDDGKQVTQGEPLVQLDDQDTKNQIKTAESQLEVSKAAMLKTEANLESSQRSYDRIKTLVEQGAVAQVELENAETSLKMVKADEASCQAAIQAAQTTIDNLQTTLADMVVRAPISGVMDGKNVSVGQFLTPGNVLGTVKDIALIDASIEVDQALIQNITIEQKATVKLNEDDTAYEGVVKSITPSADPSSRAFKVKIQLNNENLSLRPGVFAKVMLTDDTKTQSFVIPVSVIIGNEGNYYVYINDNGVVKKQTVTVGNLANNQAEIKSGLKGNESIISTNLNMLQEGDEITVVSE